MPIYEYSCRSCGHDFEMIVFSSSDENLVECPECGRRKAVKKMSRPARTGGGCGDSCAATSCGT